MRRIMCLRNSSFLLLFLSVFFVFDGFFSQVLAAGGKGLQAPLQPPSLAASSAKSVPPRGVSKTGVKEKKSGQIQSEREGKSEKKEVVEKHGDAVVAPAPAPAPAPVVEPVEVSKNGENESETSPAAQGGEPSKDEGAQDSKTNTTENVVHEAKVEAPKPLVTASEAVKIPSGGEKKSAVPLKEEKDASKVQEEVVPVVAAPLDQPISPKKPRKSKKPRNKRLEVAENPSQIPAEWNWFNSPIRISLKEGKVVLETEGEAVSFIPAQAEVVARPEKKEQDAHSVVVPKKEEKQQPLVFAASATPLFERAMQGMNARKERRLGDAGRHQIVLPSQGGTARHVPKSLLRLMDAIEKIMDRLPPDSNLGGVPVSEKLASPASSGENQNGKPISVAMSPSAFHSQQNEPKHLE
ncbi:MAG: hypothetical protein WA705_17630 [Candidatus Ozemobacteraceae bacterium]